MKLYRQPSDFFHWRFHLQTLMRSERVVEFVWFYLKTKVEGGVYGWISRCKALLKPNRNDDKMDNCCSSRDGVKRRAERVAPEA